MDSTRLIERILEEKKRWLGVFLCIIGGTAVLVGYWQSGPDPLTFAEAEAAFENWQKAEDKEKFYPSMRDALEKVPQIKSKHTGTIAQELLFGGQIDEALVFASEVGKRVKDEVPFHIDYGKTTLLIEKDQLQKALEKAVCLKELMGEEFLQEEKGGALLYLHNLIRIASLQKSLGNQPGELAAWSEVEEGLRKCKNSAKTLLSYFSEESISLIDYIHERKRVLS